MTPAASLRREILEPALDARSHNLAQQRLIANVTADCDCLLDHISALLQTATPDQREHLAALLQIIVDLAHSNVVEGGLQRQIAGAADTLARDAQRSEHAPMAPAWGIKRVATALRAPLADLCNPIIQGAARDQALAAVREVFRHAPGRAVVNVAVRHELGVKKYTKLVELHTEWTTGGRL